MRQQREVDGHELDDRAQAGHRRADARADDRVLGDRRVADALLAELVEQSLGHLEGALEDADVLAHDEDALVAPHLLRERRDENVFIMGEDVGVFQGAFKVTEGLLDEFGERRVRDTPISENTIVGTGVGAAMAGLRPVVEIMTVNFALLAMDQIVNHTAAIPYMFNGQVRVPLVIRMPGGGGHQLGPTHSHSFEAMFLQIPGPARRLPSTPADGKGLLKAAIRDDNPVIFIEHETLYGVRGEVPEDDGDARSSTSARPRCCGRGPTSRSSASSGWPTWPRRRRRRSRTSTGSRPR